MLHILTGVVARPAYCNGQHANLYAFAALDASGTISAWGGSDYGGSGAPTGSGFVAIASTGSAFAALDASGTISAWGSSIGVCQAVDRSRAAEYDAYCDDNCNYTPPNCDVSFCTQDCLDGR